MNSVGPDRVCKRCLFVKSEDYFRLHTVSGKTYRHSWCEQCISDNATDRRVEKKYGVSPQRYKELLEKQGGCCAICRSPNPSSSTKTKRFAVDHDHVTGTVRGLLCKFCNIGLGQFKDSIPNLQAAITYLQGDNEPQERD